MELEKKNRIVNYIIVNAVVSLFWLPALVSGLFEIYGDRSSNIFVVLWWLATSSPLLLLMGNFNEIPYVAFIIYYLFLHAIFTVFHKKFGLALFVYFIISIVSAIGFGASVASKAG